MRTTCPHCERPIEIVVRRPAETTKPAPGGAIGRLLGANRYEMTARPVRARVRYDQAVEPATPVTQPIQVTGFWDVVSRLLFPDEPERVTSRPPQLEDVTVPFIGAVITGFIVAAGSLFIVIPKHLPWTVVAGAGLAGVGVFWLASARRLLGRHGIVASIERIVQADIDGDGVIGDAPTPVPAPVPMPVVEVIQQQKRAGRLHERRSQLPKVKAGPEAMARWFWRVVREDGRSFSIRTAKNYHITSEEVAAIQGYFIHEGQADKLPNNWVIPNESGLDAMWSIVKRYYPDARLPSETETGLQNDDLDTDTQTDTGF